MRAASDSRIVWLAERDTLFQPASSWVQYRKDVNFSATTRAETLTIIDSVPEEGYIGELVATWYSQSSRIHDVSMTSVITLLGNYQPE